jgi:TonB family protein
MNVPYVALALVIILTGAAPLSGSPSITGEQALKLAVSTPKPGYPLAARASRITGNGTFILHIQVRTGFVRQVDIEHSTSSRLLDSAAVAALKNWRFKPGTLPTIAQMQLHRKYPNPTEDSLVRVPIHFVM